MIGGAAGAPAQNGQNRPRTAGAHRERAAAGPGRERRRKAATRARNDPFRAGPREPGGRPRPASCNPPSRQRSRGEGRPTSGRTAVNAPPYGVLSPAARPPPRPRQARRPHAGCFRPRCPRFNSLEYPWWRMLAAFRRSQRSGFSDARNSARRRPRLVSAIILPDFWKVQAALFDDLWDSSETTGPPQSRLRNPAIKFLPTSLFHAARFVKEIFYFNFVLFKRFSSELKYFL